VKIDCGLCYHFYTKEATVSLVAGMKRGGCITGRTARCRQHEEQPYTENMTPQQQWHQPVRSMQ
jgi:hypothetical protein